ncbi:hypothetical protein CALCODRAFT_540093 [Calocera cornea HHB12733]|uniref:Nephrocystin 3-like N-terminal domain-containing protein n=1 Tax=Calocera cornea HHB12733 TaxID=1353952 RepID=A0A165GN01_9BASI|nr:hypothetical protein CALCODRAFT_540093 [Calocera cornea HHB12733]
MNKLLQKNPWLGSASGTAQFQGLILAPSIMSLYPQDRPIVLVIDGLDESDDEECVDIVAQEFPKLPATFRIIVTSRPLPEIEHTFAFVPVVHRHAIPIRGVDNIWDVCLYTRQRLDKIAKDRHNASADWPGVELRNQLIEKAGGHFLWIYTAVEILSRHVSIDNALVALLNTSGGSSVEVTMDELYTILLEKCPWDDDEFAVG